MIAALIAIAAVAFVVELVLAWRGIPDDFGRWDG